VKFLSGSADGSDVLRAQLRRIEEVGDVEAETLLAGSAQLLEEIEIFKIATRAVDARKAVFIGPFHAGAQRLEIFVSRRLGSDARYEPLRRFFQRPGGFVRFGIAYDGAVGRIGSCIGDSGEC